MMLATVWQLSAARRYGIGIGFAIAALLIQVGLHQPMSARGELVFFVASSSFAALTLGLGPALVIFIVGAAFGMLVSPPVGSLYVESAADRLALVAYAVATLLFVFTGEWMRRLTLRAIATERARDARFHRVIDSSAVPFSLLRPVTENEVIVDFVLEYANPASLSALKLSANQAIGRNIREILPGTWDHPGLFDRYVRVLSTGQSDQFELYRSGNGIQGWFQVSSCSTDGRVAVWYTDITAQKQSAEFMADIDRRKDIFIATLAHELRNPLAPIRSSAALMKLENVTTQQRAWAADVIERQTASMTVLLEDLLDASRISRGTLQVTPQRIRLQDVISAALETSHTAFGPRRLRLQYETTETPIFVSADPLRLSQVLVNLLTNAAKFSSEGSSITVLVRVEEVQAVIDIIDQGAGISPQHLERVFGLFEQLHPLDARTPAGLGLGLAVARALTELQGGTLQAYSAGEGCGSTFTVRIPLSLGAAVDTAAESAMPTFRARRIVIVDDNRDAADALALFLASRGHQVDVAYSGDEALRLANDIRPEVAILDLHMPGMSGLQVAETLRESGLPTTLVAVTGFGQELDREAAQRAGIERHFLKPVSPIELAHFLEG